jgi:hypothetical protein
MKEAKVEKGSFSEDTVKRGEVKPARPEETGQRPKPTPNPPKKK